MHVFGQLNASSAFSGYVQDQGIPATQLIGNTKVHSSTLGVRRGVLNLVSIHPAQHTVLGILS